MVIIINVNLKMM